MILTEPQRWDSTFLYAARRVSRTPRRVWAMDDIVIERGCFVGLVASAVEAYNRETNGFLVGNRGPGVWRRRPREVTVLRAAYPLQTEAGKPNWVSHGNEKAFRRARGVMENADVGYAVLGGFHSPTGGDGAASLSAPDLEYVSDELKRLSRSRSMDRAEWLEVVVALKPREWSRRHEAGWTTRRYRRKLGCTVAIDPTHGYDMTIGGGLGGGGPGGGPGARGAVGPDRTRLVLPWGAPG